MKINNMNLRMIGIGEAEWVFLKDEILRSLSDKMLTSNANRNIETVNVKITLPEGMAEQERAGFITNSILSQLNYL